MYRCVINGKAGKAAALPKSSDISQLGGTDYAQPLALPHISYFRDYAPERLNIAG